MRYMEKMKKGKMRRDERLKQEKKKRMEKGKKTQTDKEIRLNKTPTCNIIQMKMYDWKRKQKLLLTKAKRQKKEINEESQGKEWKVDESRRAGKERQAEGREG